MRNQGFLNDFFHYLKDFFAKQIPLKPFQALEKFSRWQTHHVIERTFKSADADIANPLLDAVGTRLVVRFAMLNVIIDFVSI